MNKNKAVLYSIYLVVFLDSIGSGLILPILPELFYNVKYRFTINETYFSREMLYCITFSLFPIANIFGTPILGALADKFGKRRIILYGVTCLTLNYTLNIISILTHNVWLFLCGSLLNGFLAGTQAVGAAIISDISETENERIKNFKTPTLLSTIGLVISPCFSILIDKVTIFNPLILPFIIASLFGIINCILLYYNLKITISTQNKTSNKSSEGKGAKNLNLLRILKFIFSIFGYIFTTRATISIAFSYLFLRLALGLYLQSLLLHLCVGFGYLPSMLSRFFVVMVIAMTTSMYLLQSLVSKYVSYQMQIRVGLACMSLLFIIYSLMRYKFLIHELLLIWLMTVMLYTLIPFVLLCFNNLFVASVSKEEQGRVMSGMSQISSISMLIASLLLGHYVPSHDTVIILSGVFCAMSYIMFRNCQSPP